MALISSRYAPQIELNTQEISDFEHKLKHLGIVSVKKRRRKMASVLKYALKKTKQEMQANASRIRKRGVLRESIDTVDAAAVGYGSRIGARTGPKIRGTKKNRAYHAHLVELGTKKKRKTVKPGKKAFRFYSRKYHRWIFTKTINHGSKAQPFIKPAWEKTRNLIPGRIREKMKRIVDNAAKRMR